MKPSSSNREEAVGMSDMLLEVEQALNLARDFANASVRPDGHWCAESKSNVTVTAEYVFLRYALGLDLDADKSAYCQHIDSEQNEDGSWGLAPEIPGDVSVTVEAYLALKILGIDPGDAVMQRALKFVLKFGGIAKVRTFTRIYLATFGLFPWSAVPELPVELILLPKWSFINIYSFASWARATIVPLLIICHHKPIYALPNKRSPTNDYLDELWLDVNNKNVPYGSTIPTLLSNGDIPGVAFSIFDKVLYQLNGFRSIPFLRAYARRRCLQWILERQEATGDFAGIFPAMHASIFAFVLEGYKMDDPPVKLGIQAIENFCWQDEHGKRVQTSVSPVWDTALMSIGLSDAMTTDRHILDQAIAWLRHRQLIVPHGDWRVCRPALPPGGYSFEYKNTWYPDVDDTAAIILAQIKHDVRSIGSSSVIAAATWIAGMQNSDGGWAAFDVDNNKLFINHIPFNDMGSLCDTSCADITGHILEAFGLMKKCASEETHASHCFSTLESACSRGIQYLQSTQESSGPWFGRWGCNYICGTSNALCGLAYFSHDVRVSGMVHLGLQWLKSKQQADGGWGESLLSYQSSEQDQQDSTSSQTAWALMALLAHLSANDPAIEKGIRYLVINIRPEDGIGSSWPETVYTGTGFPNHFYIGYTYYRHYFPMMALGRYLQKRRVE